jgi:hypothetical protein
MFRRGMPSTLQAKATGAPSGVPPETRGIPTNVGAHSRVRVRELLTGAQSVRGGFCGPLRVFAKKGAYPGERRRDGHGIDLARRR